MTKPKLSKKAQAISDSLDSAVKLVQDSKIKKAQKVSDALDYAVSIVRDSKANEDLNQLMDDVYLESELVAQLAKVLKSKKDMLKAAIAEANHMEGKRYICTVQDIERTLYDTKKAIGDGVDLSPYESITKYKKLCVIKK